MQVVAENLKLLYYLTECEKGSDNNIFFRQIIKTAIAVTLHSAHPILNILWFGSLFQGYIVA